VEVSRWRILEAVATAIAVAITIAIAVVIAIAFVILSEAKDLNRSNG